MNRRLLTLLLLAAALALHVPAAPTSAQSPADQIISLVNALRAARGLPPYSPNAALMAAAQSHANWMAANGSYTHTGEGGSTPQQRATAAGYQGYVAENIVGGTNLSPGQGVVWWENSAIHYATMTSTRHIHVGAGFASAGGQNMYVLVVGVPSDYAPAPGSPPVRQAPAPPVAVPVTRSAPREDGSIVHEVQIGQTAWDIAAVYGVDLATLLRINGLPDDPILLPGDEIIVQPAAGATPLPPQPLTHKVQAGQSAWAIAARYGLTLDELLYLNGLGPDPVIQPGDTLIIRLAEGQEPPPTWTPTTPPTTHTVRSGDTLWSIAARYGLSLDDLLALNGLSMESVIMPGQELRIRAEAPPAPSPTPAPTDTPPPTAGIAVAAGETATTPAATPAVASPTPAPSPAPPTLTPRPTLALPTPTPIAVAPGGRISNILVGAVVIGLGLLLLGGMAAVELYERRRRQ